MQIDAMLSVAALTATTAGGFLGGRKTAKGEAMTVAVGTVDLLQAQVGSLTDSRNEKDAVIRGLEQRIDVLESMVTQKAEVNLVREEIEEVREVVGRIAVKVGAA